MIVKEVIIPAKIANPLFPRLATRTNTTPRTWRLIKSMGRTSTISSSNSTAVRLPIRASKASAYVDPSGANRFSALALRRLTRMVVNPACSAIET